LPYRLSATITFCLGLRRSASSTLEWLREAAANADQIEAVLMRDFKVKPGQLDALWAYAGRKKG
jgi:hypothetical protein